MSLVAIYFFPFIYEHPVPQILVKLRIGGSLGLRIRLHNFHLDPTNVYGDIDSHVHFGYIAHN